MFGKLKYLTFPEIGKVYFHTKSETMSIYDEIFKRREYLQHGIELKPENIVFDVGANIGMFTLFVNKECGSNVSIFAFEPIPQIYYLLENNASLHGLSQRNNVKLFNLGLTYNGETRKAIFSYYKNMPGNSTMKPNEKQQQFNIAAVQLDSNDIKNLIKASHLFMYILLLLLSPIRPWLIRKITKSQDVTCQLTTLSDICREYSVPHIDLLKIDVEGAELEVLRGIEDQDWPKVKQVVMEAHDVNDRVNEIKKLLISKGFKKVVTIQPDWARLWRLNNYNIYAKR